LFFFYDCDGAGVTAAMVRCIGQSRWDNLIISSNCRGASSKIGCKK